MSFININNKQANPTATYSATVIREALLSVETKNTAKVDTLVESIDHDLTLSEALEFFTAKLSAMNALNVALINEATQKEQDALEDKRTFAIAVNVIKLDESMMSEIDILAQEAKDLADFTKTFFKEFGGKIKKTADSMEWVEELYTSSITEALAINERSITKIQKEYGEVVKDMTKTVTDWKSAEGDVKTQLLEKLRALTARKKELEAELDSAVMGKDRNVELSGAFESVVNEAASLVDEVTGKAVKLPYKTKDFRGDAITVKGFTEPHKSSSSGRIQTDQGEFFPGVAGVKIVGHKFESVVTEAKVTEAKTKADNYLFKKDDLVYNNRTETVGIVRIGDDGSGEVKTDADGNVNADELEDYMPFKYNYKNAKISSSTKKEVIKRRLFYPFNESLVNESLVNEAKLKEGRDEALANAILAYFYAVDGTPEGDAVQALPGNPIRYDGDVGEQAGLSAWGKDVVKDLSGARRCPSDFMMGDVITIAANNGNSYYFDGSDFVEGDKTIISGINKMKYREFIAELIKLKIIETPTY